MYKRQKHLSSIFLLYLGVSANIENVLLSRSVDGIDLNRSIEVPLILLISREIDFFVSFKTQILLLSKVSNWILNAVLSFWIQRFLLELLKDLPVEQKYKASSKEVFPEPFAPYIKLLNFENSRSKLLKQRKFEIDIFFIDTFRLKVASQHILNLDHQMGL